MIAHADAVIRALIDRETQGRVCLAYEDVKEFNYHECQDANGNCITEDEWHSIHAAFATPKVIRSVQPDPSAIHALATLIKRFEVHIVTSRLSQARATTIEWLDMHQIPHDRITFVEGRQKHATADRFAAAVEDDYKQAVEFAKRGTLCLLMVHPWNVTKPQMSGIEWVGSWTEATKRLDKLT